MHIPFAIRKRGGRKLVVTPDGAEWAPRPRVDNAMVKALARAFRWRKMLDKGVHATMEDLARAKGVNASYVSRILRLTLLAPEIVEAILDGRQPAELQLDDLLDGSRWSGRDSANLCCSIVSVVSPIRSRKMAQMSAFGLLSGQFRAASGRSGKSPFAHRGSASAFRSRWPEDGPSPCRCCGGTSGKAAGGSSSRRRAAASAASMVGA